MARFARKTNEPKFCLMCGKAQSECRRTFRGCEGIVCQECVELLHSMLEEAKGAARPRPEGP